MTTTRGVGQAGGGAGAGAGTAGPSGGLGGATASTPGLIGGVTPVAGVSRAVLWVPPVAGAGLNGAPESPLQAFRVGQQVSAQVLVTDAAAGRALLLMDGQRVAAEVPDGLHEGQVVNLAVSSVSTERLVLRLNEGGGMPTRMPTAPLDASAVLRALDLPDTAATRAVVTALVERGQPLTRDTIVALRAVVAREAGQEIQNARGAVDALLKGIPVNLRSAALARSTASGATAAPMGSLLQELMVAIENSPPGALRTPVDGALIVAAPDLEQSPVPLATAIEAPAGALPAATPPAVPATTDARGALARLLEGMVAQNPTAAELQRVITVLQGAPEARIAQAILDAMAQATSAAVSDAGSAEVLVPAAASGVGASTLASPAGGGPIVAGAAPSPVAAAGMVVPGTAVPGVDLPAAGGTFPNLPNAPSPVNGASTAARAIDGAIDPDAPTLRGPSVPAAAIVAGAVSVAVAAPTAGAVPSAWVTAGPDARSFLGALLALFGGTTRPGAVPGAPITASTLPRPGEPTTPGTPANPVPDRAATPAAILARVIHDRLEYQQLGNAAVLARGGWENASTSTASATPNPGAPTTGARPEATASAFPANVPLPPPGDALNFSVPLAFAGQMATLELTVWRDGGRRQEAHEESTPGLHARMRLELSQLGRVGADIRIAGQNLRCRLTADRDETNALLQANGEALLDRLRGVGFMVEGLDYRPFAGTASGAGSGEAPSVVRRVDMGL